jgi:PTS system nitrogen regulatory IIA component
MNVAHILDPKSVYCEAVATSKKHALELMTNALAEACNQCSAAEILEGLTQRERLGCTGLGRSVAMPHTRLENVTESVAAFIRLDEGVAFDSPDGESVDLLLGIVVPKDCSDEQLHDVRELIEKLGDPALQQLLREAEGPSDLYGLLTNSLTTIHKTLRG